MWRARIFRNDSVTSQITSSHASNFPCAVPTPRRYVRPNSRRSIMALVGRRNRRNFGYGRQLSYAGPQALKDLFGGGYSRTVKAHSDRWQTFVRWCRSEDGPGSRTRDAHRRDAQRPAFSCRGHRSVGARHPHAAAPGHFGRLNALKT